MSPLFLSGTPMHKALAIIWGKRPLNHKLFIQISSTEMTFKDLVFNK